MTLSITSLSKQYGRFPALKDVSLDIAPGEFLALVGPSGSGKTTLLRVLAGLEKPQAGTVSFEGDDFLARSARGRRVGLVFQHYALFRHMTVAANVAFGLKVRPARERPHADAISDTVDRLLGLVQLADLKDRYPEQLSGGQKQRVALARALAIEPRLLLLDEPFGALDAKVRQELGGWLRRIHDETGVTTVFVTHDQAEAMTLADRVAVLQDGQILQAGTPDLLLTQPSSRAVFEFLGESTSVGGVYRAGRFEFDSVKADAWKVGDALADGERVTAVFRPHHAQLALTGPGLPVTVVGRRVQGPIVRWTARSESGQEFLVDLPEVSQVPGLGIGVSTRLQPLKVFIF